MDKDGPDDDRLASVPRRPHRLLVLGILAAIVALIAAADFIRHGTWPPRRAETSETDAAVAAGVLPNNSDQTGAKPGTGASSRD